MTSERGSWQYLVHVPARWFNRDAVNIDITPSTPHHPHDTIDTRSVPYR